MSIPGKVKDSQSYASDYAIGAARLALDQADCLSSELDLIVSLSISPSRIADDPAIAGPRLAHPVQRSLRAKHATVFDLLDADWTLALDFAQSHCRWLGYRNALVIRAEALADIENADCSGFSDGAGAIVLTTGSPDCRHVSSYADLGGLELASIDAISARQLDATRPVARFESRLDVATGQFDIGRSEFSAAVCTVLDDVRSRAIGPVAVLFHESWIGAVASVDDGIDHVEGARDIPNPFQLPAWLAECVTESHGTRDAERTVVL